MGKKVKAPVTRGAAKVPVIMQMEALECGAASLAMVMAYYGKWVPLEQLRLDCGVSRNGSNAKNMLLAARNYGFAAKGYRLETEDLEKAGRFPCIIHWDFNHFVVLDGFRGGKAILNDPARGICRVEMETFNSSFTGICLMIEPDEDFVPDGKPKSVLAFGRKRLKGAGPAVAFVVLCTLISALIGIIRTGFSRVFLDRLLTGINQEWLWPFLMGLTAFSCVEILFAGVREIYADRIDGKMAAAGNTAFMWKLLHLPMEFFSQRLAGDLQGRQNTNGEVANQLVHTVAPLALNAAMMVFYLVVMLRYSLPLTLIGVASVAVNVGFSRYISARRVNITRVQMRDAGKLASATVSGVDMIETIKASGAENGFFQRWSGYQASVNRQQVRFAKLNLYLGMLPSLLSALCSTAVLMLGVWFAMQGSFTVGMIMAFQGFLTAFSAPAGELISAGQTVQEMRAAMERIEDVMQYPEDVCWESVRSEREEGESYRKLSGEIEMRQVTFGYSRLAQPLIQGFDLKLKPGSSVAIVGPSGCGKSTVSKLLSGLYQPWSGEILFDGRPLRSIDRSVFTSSVAVVDQEITLFEDTIGNNIKMWDSTIEDFEMILAARDAQIYEDIMQREGGFRYPLRENGRDFSGGQCQRLEIARVLAQDPTVIILDEATSALDAKTEYDVVKAIRDRGITCVVIAHRLSTIRDCDEILVMDNGVVVERGTHASLYAKGGRYTELVSND